MRALVLLASTIIVVLLAPAVPAAPQVAEPDSAPQGLSPVDGARLASRIEFRVKGAARPAWSRQGDWIAYDKRGSDGFSDLYIAKPDNSFDRCLTCDIPEFLKQHAGNADWHPSGRFLVFQSETPFKHDGDAYPFLAIPGRNRANAIWVMSIEGKNLWQLAGQQEVSFPAHSPRFSFEGGQLAWSERVASSGTWGDWVLRVGEFNSGRGVARVRAVRTFEPAAQKAFYEVHSFTPDDRGLLFTGNLIEGQPIDGLDLYTMNLETEEVQQLTKSLARWDRFPALAPNGEVAVWSSSETMRRPPRPLARDDRVAVVQLDLWLGAVDGSWTRRLSGFNDPLSDEYAGRVMVGPSAWSPQGDLILTTVTSENVAEHSDLFLISLSETFGSGSPLIQ